MSQDKPFSPAPDGKRRGWLRRTWRDAEHWPLAGQAWHAAHAAEDRALAELKARLDALDPPAASPIEAGSADGADTPPPPSEIRPHAAAAAFSAAPTSGYHTIFY